MTNFKPGDLVRVKGAGLRVGRVLSIYGKQTAWVKWLDRPSCGEVIPVGNLMRPSAIDAIGGLIAELDDD